MKKRTATLLLCLLMLFFTACTGGAGDESVADSTSATVAVASPEPTPEQKSIAGSLRVLNSGISAGNNYADGVRGRAELLALGESRESGYILVFTEYENNTQMPLCSVSGCEHNSNLCNAWLHWEWEGDIVLLTDEYAFIVDYFDSWVEAAARDRHFFVLRFPLDGSPREILLDIPYEIEAAETVLADENALYFDVINVSGKKAKHDGWSLDDNESCILRVDIESGEIQSLRSMNSQMVVGAHNDKLFMIDYSSGEAVFSVGSAETEDDTAVAPLPQEIENFFGSYSNIFHNGIMYAQYKGEDKKSYIMAYDPIKASVIFNVECPQSMEYLRDGYIACYGKNKEFEAEGSWSYPIESDYYEWIYINAETGEQLDVPLFIEYATPQPVNFLKDGAPTINGQYALIIAPSGDNYIVASGAYHLNFSADFNTGRKASYSSISKADYWAGNNNLSEIKPFTPEYDFEFTVPEISEEDLLRIAFGAFTGDYFAVNTLWLNGSPPHAHAGTLNFLAYNLEDEWGIKNRKTAIEALDWLRSNGDRALLNKVYAIILDYEEQDADTQKLVRQDKKYLEEFTQMLISIENGGITANDAEGIITLSAWDYDRLIGLARICRGLGYIKEEEMLDYIDFAVGCAQDEYSSWNEYFTAALKGRCLYDGTGLLFAKEETEYYYNKLIANLYSIYYQIPFPANESTSQLKNAVKAGIPGVVLNEEVDRYTFSDIGAFTVATSYPSRWPDNLDNVFPEYTGKGVLAYSICTSSLNKPDVPVATSVSVYDFEENDVDEHIQKLLNAGFEIIPESEYADEIVEALSVYNYEGYIHFIHNSGNYTAHIMQSNDGYADYLQMNMTALEKDRRN